MGYETRIYIGEPSSYPDPKNKIVWFQVMGMVDCSKIGYTPVSKEVIAKGHACYFYGSDGNTRITEDCYGEKCRAVPIALVMESLKGMLGGRYTRIRWAYDMLKTMSKQRKTYHGMKATHCILFGY